MERTKLERRLEKLIALHFPMQDLTDKDTSARKGEGSVNGRGRGPEKRRASSFFNLDFKNMDPGDLWKGVLQSPMIQGSNNDIRGIYSSIHFVEWVLISLEDAEQRITPWQDDAAVSKCHLCTYVFSLISASPDRHPFYIRIVLTYLQRVLSPTYES